MIFLHVITILLLIAVLFQRQIKLSVLKEIRKTIMGLREDHEALTTKFGGVESAVTAVAEDIAALKTEIAEANERANIDLSPLIARAEGIEAGLRAAVGTGPGSDATPPVEPPA